MYNIYLSRFLFHSHPSDHAIRPLCYHCDMCDIRRVQAFCPVKKKPCKLPLLVRESLPYQNILSLSPVLITYLSDRNWEPSRYCVDFNMLWTCFVNCLFLNVCRSFRRNLGRYAPYSIELQKNAAYSSNSKNLGVFNSKMADQYKF